MNSFLEGIYMSALLDDLEWMNRIDREGMCAILAKFPEHCEEAIDEAKNLRIPRRVRISVRRVLRYGVPKEIVIVGMGGSAIGGSLFKDWLRASLPIPVEVCRGYTLPAYADEETLVLATSYSGNTEETLSCLLEAVEKQCMVIGISSNGILQEFGEKLGLPLVTIPGGNPPRSAVPYIFFSLVAVLNALEIMPSMGGEIEEAIAVLKEVREEIKPEQPISDNMAKKIAIGLQGSIPLISGFGFYESVALRMKTQFNENSKTPAIIELFPELRHNTVVGWAGPRNLTKKFGVLLIRDREEPPEIRKMIEVTKEQIFNERAATVLEIWSKGHGKLARMLSILYVGDFASVYLGILHGVNPTPTKNIDELKKHLTTCNTVGALRKKFNKLLEG
jgi:glucose/mannose-6-phosphate isomerase